MNQEEKDELFLKVATDVAETLARKNHDYGDSFHNVYAKHGDVSTFIRLTDKLGRYETSVLGKKLQVEDEDVIEVLLDIAGYAILTIASKERLTLEEDRERKERIAKVTNEDVPRYYRPEGSQ